MFEIAILKHIIARTIFLNDFLACAMGLVHQRSDKCVEKLIEIEESQNDEYEKFEKKCPDGLENVYDIGFCVKVSESFC